MLEHAQLKLHLMHNAVLGLVWLIGVADQKARFQVKCFVSPTEQFEENSRQFFLVIFDNLAVLTTSLDA